MHVAHKTKIIGEDELNKSAQLARVKNMDDRPLIFPEQYAEHAVSANRARLQAEAKEAMSPLIKELERYEIPEEKIEDVIDYTVIYFAKHHRTMKPGRMLRKITEHFKLKLKPKPDATD